VTRDPHTEIERRFLVRSDAWRGSGETRRIVQGYLNTDPQRVVRVRLDGDRARFTVKGVSAGGRRPEIECDIDADTARAILSHPALCIGTTIEKSRTVITIDGLGWEVDEFHGRNSGLVIAEVEFEGSTSLDEWRARIDRARPPWVGREITGDPRYANSALAEQPFDSW
jgi:adenylate cyclase